MSEATTHSYSLETLMHCQCGICGGWWTIGDGDPTEPQHCTKCGALGEMKGKEPWKGDVCEWHPYQFEHLKSGCGEVEHIINLEGWKCCPRCGKPIVIKA